MNTTTLSFRCAGGPAFLLICFFLSITVAVRAQQNSGFALSAEFQAYPTGLIPGLRADWQFRTHHSLQLRVGYDLVRHGNKGVQNDERGGGFGGTLGYRYHFLDARKGLFLGARADVWRNRIDWIDYAPSGGQMASGVSKIVVFQPTAEAGYRFPFGQSNWFVAPNIAFGAEINVKTQGVDVGQGPILLLGLSLGTWLK